MFVGFSVLRVTLEINKKSIFVYLNLNDEISLLYYRTVLINVFIAIQILCIYLSMSIQKFLWRFSFLLFYVNPYIQKEKKIFKIIMLDEILSDILHFVTTSTAAS